MMFGREWPAGDPCGIGGTGFEEQIPSRPFVMLGIGESLGKQGVSPHAGSGRARPNVRETLGGRNDPMDPSG
jgi:hypothetical protein